MWSGDSSIRRVLGVGEFEANLPHRDARFLQPLPLQPRDVLVQQIHAATRCFRRPFWGVIRRFAISTRGGTTPTVNG